VTFTAVVFLALTKADPQAALQCLARTVGTLDTDALREFTDGRREVVYALEMIAIWDDLFADAARLLLRLAEAENETYANNASGVFAGLFSPGYGEVAPTEASPQKRLLVLEEALTSDSEAQRLLALRACDAALETDHFSRIAGAEQQCSKISEITIQSSMAFALRHIVFLITLRVSTHMKFGN